jgi:threonyl-tRNA synthetase
MNEQTMAVRSRGGKDLGSMSIDGFLERLAADIARRGRAILED